MIEAIQQETVRRGISRICHFTPARNLVHIMAGTEGVLSTTKLSDEERATFTPTDLARCDGHPDHICCSIQYPNAWYFAKAKAKDVLFRDWVVLLIRSDYLWQDGALFCPRNAAADWGRYIGQGADAFGAMYVDAVQGAYNKIYRRRPTHLPCSPTDDQAEVLIPDRLAKKDILGIVVLDDDQARREVARLNLLRQEEYPPLYIAPTLFDKNQLHSFIERGVRPEERLWRPE